jgi:hypothetical protein
MSISETLGEVIPWVPSANKWGRSKYRRKSSGIPKKKSSPDYKFQSRKLKLSRFSDDKWVILPSGYTRSQWWNRLNHAWIGYKRALNPKNRETMSDSLRNERKYISENDIGILTMKSISWTHVDTDISCSST